MLLCDITPAHAEVLTTLHATSFDKPWKLSEFTQLLQLPTTCGWVNENGFILCSHVADEMEILTICVVPEKRRQGVAKELLNCMTDFAKTHQIAHLFLEVRADNLAAQNLYVANGFEQTGLRKGYYKTATGTCDALCFTKKRTL